jgi:hypothetical protein
MNYFDDIGLIEESSQTVSSLNEFFFKLNSLKQPGLSSEVQLESLEHCYRLRHDAAHFLLSKWLNIDFYPELSRSIKQAFPEIKYPKTVHPDISQKLNKNVALIGDVSVSRDVNLTRFNKQEKYKEIVNWTREHGYLTFFITFILEPSLSNLERELLSIQQQLLNYKALEVEDFEIALLHSFFVEVDLTIHFLKEDINNQELISRYLSEKYSQEDIFTSRKKKTDFPEVKAEFLKDHVKLRSDEEEIDLFKQLLEDPEILDKIQEKVTTPSDFTNAWETLKSSNSLFNYMDPKPSIYTPLFPLKK